MIWDQYEKCKLYKPGLNLRFSVSGLNWTAEPWNHTHTLLTQMFFYNFL